MNAKTDYERYVTPEALATDQSLPVEQKLERLENWAEDLNAGLRASGESMTSIDPGLTSALLQRVMAAWTNCRKLRVGNRTGEPLAMVDVPVYAGRRPPLLAR